jgi:peptidoglycan lytic transglycosylase
MRNLMLGCALAALVALSARSEARPPEVKMMEASSTLATPSQVGVASWYGPECQGNVTASGALFNQDALTCAHRELPLGTKIKVTNLLNQRTLVLKVNDRGPVPHNRVLDVSMGAAKRLGFFRAGVTPIRIQVLSYPHRFLTGQSPLPTLSAKLN